jgi:NAD(P)H-quinone oxidoreductase subunit 5
MDVVIRELTRESTAALALAAPALLLAAGLVPARWADAHPRSMCRVVARAAWLAFGCALLTALGHMTSGPVSQVFFSAALPGAWGAASLGVLVDALTVTMLLLVSFVGALVVRYAGNYLDGDARHGSFMKWLSLALATVLTLIVAGNWLLLVAAWIATSLCLHRLLVFYPQRPAALLAARKKFIVSRLGDGCLIAAALLVGSTLHSFEFDALFRVAAAQGGALPAQLQWAGWLVAASAVCKSAQMPFHGWLPQVMEAPTPVSALLHAGIINAGGFLVVRMSPVLVHAGGALECLALAGALTAVLAAAIMLTQTSVKAALAWSTCAQMGFMLMQCGLGAFSAAVLHIVAHALYKAHAFLSSGSVVAAARKQPPRTPAGPARPWRAVAVLSATLLLTLALAALFGVTLDHEPAIAALGAILAMALAWLQLQSGTEVDARLALRAAAGSALAGLAYFLFQKAFALLLGATVAHAAPLPPGLAMLVVALFFLLMLIQILLPHRLHRPRWRAAYVHLSNGLYLDTVFTRLAHRIWPVRAQAASTGVLS